MQLKFLTRRFQAFIFKMNLIHIAGVLQAVPHGGVHGMFKMCSVILQGTECCCICIGQVFLHFENSFFHVDAFICSFVVCFPLSEIPNTLISLKIT